MAGNLIPENPSVSKVGTATDQYGEVNALAFKQNGATVALDSQALDTFGATTDITDLDATTSKHGLMSKADKVKLDAIESAATADQSDSEIETAYNNQVNQVSAGEITAGTSTSIRRYSVADVVSLITTHSPSSALTTEQVMDIVGAGLTSTATVVPTYDDAGDEITFAVNLKSSSLTLGSQGEITSDSNGIYVKLGTAGDEAAAGNDSRFLSTDEKAAVSAANGPTALNPFLTEADGLDIKLDDFAAPDDNTDLDATTSAHGLMPKADKQRLDNIGTVKRFPIDLGEFRADSGSPAYGSDTETGGKSWAFDQTSDESIKGHIILPGDYSSGLKIKLYWWSGSTGDVVWNVGDAAAVADGEPISVASSDAAVTDSVTGANQLNVTTVFSLGGGSADELLPLFIGRVGSDASDTLAADCYLLAAVAEYTWGAISAW